MTLHAVAENLWLARFPQRLLGIDFNRNVTLIRLCDGRLVIHSTAAFSADDVREISALGAPAWLLDATLFHDTFVDEGRAAFPDVPYLSPEQLDVPPSDWAGELEVLALRGVPTTREHLFFHRASGTMIVADTLFHFPAKLRGWSRFFVRYVMRLPRLIGMSFFFRMTIKDKEAFRASARKLMEWDFDRLIVGHGEPINTGAKAVVAQALRERGLL